LPFFYFINTKSTSTTVKLNGTELKTLPPLCI
jgi:hypothetical protein